MNAAEVIWHDLECGGYGADLAAWEALCRRFGTPVLDVGAGTGRVALALARAGHPVDALELSPTLAQALERRAVDLPVRVLRADACAFVPARTYPLCIVPMQTFQLLADRRAFLAGAAAAVVPGGALAIALLGDGVEPFEAELTADETAADGVLYLSRPTALRREGGAVVLERWRETVGGAGLPPERSVQRLVDIEPEALIADAGAHGFAREGRITVAPTQEHAGSEIVVLRRRA